MNARQRRIARRAYLRTDEGRAAAAKAARVLEALGEPKYEPATRIDAPRFYTGMFFPLAIKPRPVVLLGCGI